MKNWFRIIILLVVILGTYLILRQLNLYENAVVLFLIPSLLGIYFIVLSIIYLLKKEYIESIFAFAATCLLVLIPIKATYIFYNQFFAFLLISLISIFLYKKGKTIRSREALFTLIFLNTFLFMIPDRTLLEYFDKHSLYWHKISFSEFKGLPPNNRIHKAEIMLKLNFKINRVYNYPPAIVGAAMDPNTSWVNPIFRGNPATLIHEQFHFNILEYNKLLLLDSIKNCWLSTFHQKQAIVKYYYDIADKMQNYYDTLYVKNDTVSIYKMNESIYNRLKENSR